ncbi:hypothetical protein AB1A81_04565 [Bdellovibrio bacteriovorus]|uniref:Uncharacterized protein n=1 Tax=Bdellovibrio bacteriovorus (strain ATCC 15356 / DSM 50701 / NCIMB 9529 / HD100) TaxID=264462 RepID=Q6MP73_BDEBA|nr:hypothetical protein [Bdellovibrio bacteriovorus]AHZ86240.1 hypothetical protein EP01_15050 [Bdellovibrio bacteriovorus]BEV67477.1 hypothetical protein Bb109J_c0897 [Bdellovibrio bacteriovorus]CAE78925.1 conserved hypothetical protein [Bdellovibrio bacteriovorus HD100]
MIKVLIATLLYSVCSSAAPVATSAGDTAEISVQDGIAKVSLPAEARKALIDWNPEFLIFDLKDYPESVLSLIKDVEPNGVPMAFIADLDNNGDKDIVLLGSDLHRQYAVALTKKDGVWQAVEIQSWNIPNIKKTVLKKEDKTKETGIPLYVLPAEDEHAKKLGKKVGIQVERYLGPATVYEIKDGKASKVVLE